MHVRNDQTPRRERCDKKRLYSGKSESLGERFLPVLKEGFARHGIATNIYSGTVKSAGCEYILSYTALQSWDFVPYLSQAELWLEKDGRQIGYAEYHLIGKGGLSLMKWEGRKTKMDPVLDELLGNVSNAVVGTSETKRNHQGP